MAGKARFYAGTIGVALIVPVAVAAAFLDTGQPPAPPSTFRIVSAGTETTPPVISLASASATRSAATITWTTNEPSDTQVIYGPTTAFGSTSVLNATAVTSHTVNVIGLAPGTRYYFRARSRDAAGNLGQSAVATFTTSGGIADSYPGDVGIEAHPDVIFVERFDEGALSGLFSRWTDVLNGTAMSFTSDLPAGSPGTVSLNIPWVGGGVNNGGHLYKQLSPGVDDTLYVRYYIKYPTTGRYSHNGIWVGGYNPPIGWPNPQAGLKPAGNDRFSAAAEQDSATTKFDHYDYWMDMHLSADSSYWGNLLLNDPNVKGATGRWVCVEQMVKLNNPVSASNGEQAIWIDGAKVSHVGPGFPNGSWSGGIFTQSATGTPFGGLRWRSDANLNINYIWLQNYSPNDPAGFASSMKFAHVVAAKNYIGCLVPASGVDTTPPSVSISAPSGGSTVSGIVTLTAAASDNVGVAGVQFKVDGVPVGGEDASAPYSAPWNTTALTGNHTITAVARDAAGNVSTSPAVTVTVGSGLSVVTFSPQDTNLNLDATNHSSDTTMTTYTWPNNKIANAILMKFDLSSLPAGAVVQDATLNLALVGSDTGAEATYTVTVHKVVGKNPVIAAATGYTADGTTPWTPNACCSSNVPLAQADISPAYDTQAIDKATGFKSWTIWTMVQEWLTDPATNFGLLLNSDTSKLADRYRSFASTENSIASLRPTLTVRYSSVPDTTAPSVSITAPAGAATVSGTTTVSAAASDNIAVAGVQFKLDGANLGAEDLTAPYTISWDTTAASAGSHILTAVARDAAGNSATSAGVNVTVANDTTPPVVSAVTASSITTSGATLSWTTNEASDSQVEYGLTTAYGSSSALSANLVASHAVGLSGLVPSTAYHARARSRDAAGNLAVSGDVPFTMLAAPDVTPPTVAISAPVTGATVSGTAAVSANASDNVGVAGVQFKLDGANLGAEVPGAPYTVAWNTQGSSDLIFGVTKVAVGGMTISAGTGFTKRLSVSCPSCSGDDMMSEDKVQTAAGSTAATFTFSTAAHYLAQMAAFKAAGTPGYVQGAAATSQQGTPTIVKAFGSPITAGNLIVAAVAWQGNAALNVTDSQGNVYTGATTAYDAVNAQTLAIVYAANVKSGATTVTAGFGGAAPSVQRLEIHEYSGIATTNPLDVTAMTIGDGVTTADTITSGSATTTVSPAAANGAHTLTAVARDAAGNSTTSAGVSVTVLNDTTPPVVSAVTASAITTSGATIRWTTNEASDSQVEYGLTTSYGSASALTATLVAAHTVGLSGLAAGTPYHYRVRSTDAAGNLAVSGDFTFTSLAAPDVTPPTVAITAPGAGATVANTVAVSANASDNVGVAGVQFKLDGVNLGAEDTTSPYSVSWNTTTSPGGAHTLTAVARDAAGNLKTSTAVAVVVTQPTAQVILRWDTNTEPDLAGYKVYIGTASRIYSSPVDVGNITSFTVTGLTPGTVYYFVVSAYDLNGYESGWSNEVSAIR